MKINWTIAILLLILMGNVLAQEQERRLWDSEFLKKRASPSKPADKKVSYKRVTPKPAAPAAAKAETAPAGEMIGVTVWKLRAAAKQDDAEARLLIPDDGDSGGWIPERVESDKTFAAGDRVRLSIESPRDGYLYVIDREQYADGTQSEPYLIFPTLRIRNGDNRVSAGKVITIPDKTAFQLKPSRNDYAGESLLLLISKEPLAEVSIGPSIIKLDDAQVAKWQKQWNVEAEKFEMVGGAGKAWTKAEKEASQEGSKILTQDDELPQTLYRVVTRPENAVLITVPLRIK